MIAKMAVPGMKKISIKSKPHPKTINPEIASQLIQYIVRKDNS